MVVVGCLCGVRLAMRGDRVGFAAGCARVRPRSEAAFGCRCGNGAQWADATHVAGIGGDGIRHVAGCYQPRHAEHRQRAVPVGASAIDLSGELHPDVRPPALVSARVIHRRAFGAGTRHGVADSFTRARVCRVGFFWGPVCRVHVLPRRACLDEA